MNEHQNAAARTIAAYVIAWVASWTIGEVKDLVGIASGLIIAGFGATQWYVLWREKITRIERERIERETGHGGL